MKNISIIYWSGTGNTCEMAKGVLQGAQIDGVEVKLINVSEANIEDVLKADGIGIGCPSMGQEQLEESEMDPFIESISEAVRGKNIVLFGSYGWGDGEWMRNWEERMDKYGAKLLKDGLIINETPDDKGIDECIELGEILAKS